MGRFAMALLLGGLAAGGIAAPAHAQYYDETPRPYYEGPPPRYRGPPPRRVVDLGDRCRVRLRTDIGRTRYVCPIVQAKPVGAPCACPPPRGYGPGPYLDGIVIN